MSKRRKILVVLGLIVLLPFVVLKVLVWVTGPPDDLGVREGRLAPCPDTPNCVSSQATDEQHAIAPLSFEGEPAEALARLKGALRSMPRVTVVEESGTYIRVEFRTALMRFVDDGEFLLDAQAKRIHFRSAARLGYSDLGKNRERMETLRDAFQSAR